MSCELHDCCQFFKDNMAGLPMAADYIKKKLCFGEYHRCARYQIYQESGEGDRVSFHTPSDEEEVVKIIRCLRNKRDDSNR